MSNKDLDSKTYFLAATGDKYIYWASEADFVNAVKSSISVLNMQEVDADLDAINIAKGHVTDWKGLNQAAKSGQVYGYLKAGKSLYINNTKADMKPEDGDIILG